eukprot:3180354-Prymnesium_polylepis.1
MPRASGMRVCWLSAVRACWLAAFAPLALASESCSPPPPGRIIYSSEKSTLCADGWRCDQQWQFETDCMWQAMNGYKTPHELTTVSSDMVVCPADIEADWPVRIRVDGTSMLSGDLATRNLTDWLEHTID